MHKPQRDPYTLERQLSGVLPPDSSGPQLRRFPLLYRLQIGGWFDHPIATSDEIDALHKYASRAGMGIACRRYSGGVRVFRVR